MRRSDLSKANNNEQNLLKSFIALNANNAHLWASATSVGDLLQLLNSATIIYFSMYFNIEYAHVHNTRRASWTQSHLPPAVSTKQTTEKNSAHFWRCQASLCSYNVPKIWFHFYTRVHVLYTLSLSLMCGVYVALGRQSWEEKTSVFGWSGETSHGKLWAILHLKIRIMGARLGQAEKRGFQTAITWEADLGEH